MENKFVEELDGVIDEACKEIERLHGSIEALEADNRLREDIQRAKDRIFELTMRVQILTELRDKIGGEGGLTY